MSDQPAAPVSAPSSRVPWIVAGVSWVATLALVAVLIVGGSGGGAASGSGAAAERGFSSADAAARAYADAIAEGDLDAAASMYATTSLVEGYSFTKNLEYVRAIMPQTLLPAPDFNGVNARVQAGYAGNSMLGIARSLLMPGEDPFMTIAGEAVEDAAAWEETLSIAGFEEISVERVDLLEPGSDETRYAEFYTKTLEAWSGEEAREGAILFETADGTAMLGVTLIKLDGSWYVWRANSTILGTTMSTVELISEADYVDRLEYGQDLVNR